ncbi:MAG: hypothetical protein HRU72_00015 [Planctomycetia bacterium]|nr:MAG: hypothetical protein HRU72_00015 [Planctomycetia bacterium]
MSILLCRFTILRRKAGEKPPALYHSCQTHIATPVARLNTHDEDPHGLPSCHIGHPAAAFVTLSGLQTPTGLIWNYG